MCEKRTMDAAHLNEYLRNAIFGNSLTAETAKQFIDNGGDVNQRDKGRRTPLHYYADNFQIAKLPIDAGVDINAGDCDGKTPLFEAHLNGNVCKYLIEKGSNVNRRDKKGGRRCIIMPFIIMLPSAIALRRIILRLIFK